jgi:hypothetical protein
MRAWGRTASAAILLWLWQSWVLRKMPQAPGGLPFIGAPPGKHPAPVTAHVPTPQALQAMALPRAVRPDSPRLTSLQARHTALITHQPAQPGADASNTVRAARMVLLMPPLPARRKTTATAELMVKSHWGGSVTAGHTWTLFWNTPWDLFEKWAADVSFSSPIYLAPPSRVWVD